MSLSSFLVRRDVREKFAQQFPAIFENKTHVPKVLRVPRTTTRPCNVGIAFDYLVRFWLERTYPELSEKSVWVAEYTVSPSDPHCLSELFFEQGLEIFAVARAGYTRFLEDGIFRDDLLEAVFKMTYLDGYFRSRCLPSNGEFLVDSNDIEDLKALLAICDVERWKPRSKCQLNPTFGVGSALVGGADADFVIDDRLVELKVVANFNNLRNYKCQLLGYSVLQFLAEQPQFHQLEIYSARHGETLRWPAPDWSLPQHTPFLLWFCEEAARCFQNETVLSLIENLPQNEMQKIIHQIEKTRNY